MLEVKAVIVVYVKSRTALEQVLGSHARSLRTSRDEGEKTHPFRTQLWWLKWNLAFRKVRARPYSLPALCVSTCLFPAASDSSECLCLQVLCVTLRDAANVQGAFAQVLLVKLDVG